VTTKFERTERLAEKVARTAAQAGLLAAAILFVCSASVATTDQIFDKTYPLTSGGNFQLDNVNGSVQVDGWDRDEVEVNAVKTAQDDPSELDRVQIDVESQPGQVAVHTRYPSGEGTDVAVEYHVHVPYKVLLSAVKTVNGSVCVRGVNGGGDLRSVNGDVEVSDSTGPFNAKTTNGDLRVQLRQIMDGAPMNIETVNGSVVLMLPSDAGANLSVENMNGEFSSELPMTGTSAPVSSRNFRAKLGAGGGQISLRTINGGIRLMREGTGPGA